MPVHVAQQTAVLHRRNRRNGWLLCNTRAVDAGYWSNQMSVTLVAVSQLVLRLAEGLSIAVTATVGFSIFSATLQLLLSQT